jgi:hypothetical protein
VDDSCVELGDVAVVGGGCYGSFYAGQLARARARGRARCRRVLVVDRDPACRAAATAAEQGHAVVVAEWGAFFDDWLARDAAAGDVPDAIVPSPLMPHLMFEWLLRRARRRWPGRPVAAAPVARPLGTPYDRLAEDGTRYVSFADWLCPVHCVEPGTCPLTRGPRTWEMADAVSALVERSGRDGAVAGPAIFRCRHRVYGVGAFDVPEVLAADRLVAEAGAGGGAVDVVVGTVSSCHGAVSVLRLGPV